MSKQTLYLGGPMTGYPQFNFPAFDRASAKLREHGYTIVSPAELDDPETRDAALASADGAPGTGSHSGQTWADFLARDVKLIADKVDGIVLLDGWAKSKGARLETFVCFLDDKPAYLYRPEAPGLKIPLPPEQAVAAWHPEENKGVREELFGLPVVVDENHEGPPMFVHDPAAVVGQVHEFIEDGQGIKVMKGGNAVGQNQMPQVKTTEVRVKDEKTGGEKGQKIHRYDLIPQHAEEQDALVYGAGAQKYADDNWRLGYSWRLSLGALKRHLGLWKKGERYDEELSELAGQPVEHLACVRWHAATLMEFEEFGLGTDDIADRRTDA